MNARSLFPLAATTGFLMIGTGSAQDAAKAPVKTTTTSVKTTGNQQLADDVATRLASSGAAQLADVSISVNDGVVTLTGYARDESTRSQVIQEVRKISGVKKVRDGLMLPSTNLMQAQAMQGMLPPAAGPVMPQMAMGVPPSMGGPQGMMAGEPTPVGGPAMGGPGGIEGQAPPLPPYAWPTYAPHNNVSRVGYPTAYPYNAFPFIGPFYPFPKVPLGWRKVTMEWDDGHWWIGKTQAPHDYWRVRFW